MTDRSVTRPWADMTIGQELGEVCLHVTYDKVVGVAAATWDYFPGHHDPEYAQAQGRRTIYLNTMVLGGFLDRIVTTWSGPGWFISRRQMVMVESVYAGDTLMGTGRVATMDHDLRGPPTVEVEVMASTALGVCVRGSIMLTLLHPAMAGGRL